jgi:SAM-dependent methyltransferase
MDDEAIRQAVDRTRSPTDQMFQGNVDHYDSVGESALRVLRATIRVAGVKTPQRVLDYGAGAGRVTRWLVAAFPEADIHACDIRPDNVDFLRNQFKVETWAVDPDPATLKFPASYDLIWVGSVITHLPETRARRLIVRLLSQCNPGGLLVLSLHGRTAITLYESGRLVYIHPAGWERIRARLAAGGYGYADYDGQHDYGISVCTAAWITRLVEEMPEARTALYGERLWDNHHDVIGIQRVAG